MTEPSKSCPSCGAFLGGAAFCPSCGAQAAPRPRRGPARRPYASGSYGPGAWEKLDRSTHAERDLKLGGRALYDRILRPIGRTLTGAYHHTHVEERPADEFDELLEPAPATVERRLGLGVLVLGVLVLAVVVLLIAMLT